MLRMNVFHPARTQETVALGAGSAAVLPSSRPSVFFIADHNNGICFLVDTGAEVSVTHRRHKPRERNLVRHHCKLLITRR